jgi:hypothetical protein
MRLFILPFLVAVSTLGYSQCPSKGITTNPDAPVNPERPSRTNSYFDWRTQFYKVNSINIPATQIESPFFQGYQNANVISLFSNKDMSPTDGWELIKYDMGFYKKDIAQNPPIDYVYLILYNKLTGVLRVFLAGNFPQAFNGASIQLKFGSRPDTKFYSSILSNASKIFALDKFESNPTIVAVAPYLNGLGKWFYADFQMTYDPCTCFYESLLQVEVKLINEAIISLTGSLTGTITSISQNSGSVSQNGYSVKDIVTAGMKAQKSFNSVADFTNEQEKAFNIAGKSNLELTIEQLTKRNQLNEFQNVIKTSAFLKAGLKAAPYVAAAFELVDFFSGGGRSSAQQVEIMPMAINATIDLKGSLRADYRYRDISFFTPGSKDVATKDTIQYPYYNEVLGVFNLLTTPRAYYKVEDGEDGYNVPMNRTYQLIDQIEYVMNPAAGFIDVEIMGSIVLRNSVTGTIRFQTGFLPITALNDFSINSFVRVSCPATCDTSIDRPEIKLLVNLKRGANQQNVAFVASYPLELIQAPTGFNFDTDIYRYVSDWKAPRAPSDKAFNGLYSNADLNAYKSVTLTAGTTLYPTSTARTYNSGISDFSSYSTSLAPASSARVYEFCNTGSYSTNQSRNARIQQSENFEDQNDELLDKKFSAFPNPTTGKVSFRYYVEESSQVRLKLISTTGSIVASPVDAYQEAGPYEISYDASSLPAGIYIYTLETNKGKETKRLVILK